MARALTAAVVLLLDAAGCGTANAASLVDPALHFRVLRTPHFVIYFHQGEDPLAARLSAIAEDAWTKLTVPLGASPPRLTHVVLVDQSELANGWATPLPYDTVFVTAAWPTGSDFIGNTDDWLRLVFTHEFTHIVHLDRSKGWATLVRGVFGRMPLAFPNLLLPAWQIEGLATYEESAIAGEGRLHSGDFRAIVSEAARAARLEPLDRVNGPLTDWPDGLAQYAYGLGFHTYLAERFGADRLARLADATAGRVPYTASRVFRRVFGESLGDLWRDYETATARASAPPAADGATRLTRHGFVVRGPRFDRDVCATCPQAIVYSVRTPHQFPSLNVINSDGSSPRRIATRYLGAATAPGRDAIYFDQQEIKRNTGLYSDLYALDRSSGRVRRLTSEARLLDPDLAPDGRTIVCVRSAPGRRELVLVRLKPDATEENPSTSVVSAFRRTVGRTATIETLISEPDTQFDAPRWSPDGRFVAVERHVLGALSQIVVVDPSTKAVRVVAAAPAARIVTPTWTADGHAVVAAVAPEDEPFNLYEFPVDDSRPSRQLTHTTGGATWPDVSPDGRTLVFVGYTVDGFDLFEMPYSTGSSGVAQAFRPARDAPDAELKFRATSERVMVERATSEYRPWSTLRPTSWSPIVEGDRNQFRVGAATSGFDVLGYHGYAVAASWLVSAPADAPTPTRSNPDWQVYYAYDRWRPLLWLSASTQTSFFAGPARADDVPSTATLRERQLEAGVALPIRHVRASQTALASVARSVDEFTLADGIRSRNRTALRAAWTATSAQTYGYSISPEHGIRFGATAEIVRRSLGATADANAATADLRLYLPSFAQHHVAAVRLAGGVSTGDAVLGRTFHLGGAIPNSSTIDFGRQAVSLLRGFGSDTFAGSRVALVNADYRWPLVRPQRGIGTWPAFLHTVHAAVFADAGDAWTRAFRARNLKTSVGGELSADVVAGYWFPFTLTVGAARGHDGSGMLSDRWSLYARIGRAY